MSIIMHNAQVHVHMNNAHTEHTHNKKMHRHIFPKVAYIKANLKRKKGFHNPEKELMV
jgi:hypothetical protein